MVIERRYIPDAISTITLRQREDGGQVLYGFGAVYYDGTPRTEFQLRPGLRERIMPAAFERAIQEDDIRALFNHGIDNLLGRTGAKTMRIRNESQGPFYEIDLPETDIGQRVKVNVERGDISGASWGFIVGPGNSEFIQAEDGDGDVRQVYGFARVLDMGPVTFEAYGATTVGVRAEGSLGEIEAEHAAWREGLDAAERTRRFKIQARAKVVELGV